MAEHDLLNATLVDRALDAGGAGVSNAGMAAPNAHRTSGQVGGARGRTRARSTTGPARQRPRRVLWWAIAALLAVAAVAVLAWRALPRRVPVAEVVRGDVARTLVLTGRVRPPARPLLGASVAGTVRDVLVREGDRVTRGQLLVRVDDAQQAAAVAQARAALAVAAAGARSTADQAALAVEQTRRDLERARALQAQGAISARELEVAERAAADAQSELDAARARSSSGTSAPLADVARARAEVDAAEARRQLMRITAPTDATVLVRSVEPGDVVTPGQVLIELALDGPTELVAFAREENLRDLRTGDVAVASADAFPELTFDARVARVAPVVNPAQGTVEIRFAVPEAPTYLRADMTVSINVEVARRDGALVIPIETVRDLGSAAPWVVVASDGRAIRRPVRLGIVGDREVEVLDGVDEGELLLSVPIEPGQRVRVALTNGTAAPATRRNR